MKDDKLLKDFQKLICNCKQKMYKQFVLNLFSYAQNSPKQMHMYLKEDPPTRDQPPLTHLHAPPTIQLLH
jgi:hypothetical protein